MAKTTQAYEDFLQGVSNKYLDFIEACKIKYLGYSKEEQYACYTHHIVPRHHYKKHRLNQDTLDLLANLVRMNFNHHVEAHELRWEVYREAGDKAAFMRMKGHTEEGMRAM